MKPDLSRSLHTLIARLDRAADRMLREEAGLSYARFLALYMVGREGSATQRELAARLAITEPSVSRMVKVLVAAGHLETSSAAGGGNRRRLTLTPAAEVLVGRWGAELEERLGRVLAEAGVPYARYRAQTERLIEALDPA